MRDRLGVGLGDRLRYLFDQGQIRIEKALGPELDDPFAVFAEWSSDADEEAYGDL